MRIGEPAKASGVRTRSLRYPEEQGLPPAERLGNGYREYDEQAVRRVAFIQDLSRAGLSSELSVTRTSSSPRRHRFHADSPAHGPRLRSVTRCSSTPATECLSWARATAGTSPC
ncbi:MerR family transcriptional regulator [Streptomyces collinus]|uniref:MerR family transcriptional regulator n=1 Tax=Streptomyces collinus TaxID=42684 RepID=UPI0029438AB2|nr:MerR family transcriptional regulator [Streptomyces collinus]